MATAANDFPLTRAEVMRAREEVGFVTPLAPIEPGSLWCIFEQRGTYEFLVHPETADAYIEYGMCVDGKWLEVSVIDQYPMMGAFHILVVDPDANKEFLPDVRQGIALEGHMTEVVPKWRRPALRRAVSRIRKRIAA